MDEIPIACTLPAAELRERERTVLSALGAQVRKVEARPDGYALELAATDEGVAAATTFIQVERRCCPSCALNSPLTLPPAPDG